LCMGRMKNQKERNRGSNWKRLWIRHLNMTKTMSQPTLGPYLQREQTMSRNNESRQYSTGSKQYNLQQTQGEESPKQLNRSYVGAWRSGSRVEVVDLQCEYATSVRVKCLILLPSGGTVRFR
jgi:hypothetical protein